MCVCVCAWGYTCVQYGMPQVSASHLLFLEIIGQERVSLRIRSNTGRRSKLAGASKVEERLDVLELRVEIQVRVFLYHVAVAVLCGYRGRGVG